MAAISRRWDGCCVGTDTSRLSARPRCPSEVLDLHRFDLLKVLHIGLPADGAAERVLWEQLSGHASLRSELAIPHKHD
jgi:hypothetical protein